MVGVRVRVSVRPRVRVRVRARVRVRERADLADGAPAGGVARLVEHEPVAVLRRVGHHAARGDAVLVEAARRARREAHALVLPDHAVRRGGEADLVALRLRVERVEVHPPPLRVGADLDHLRPADEELPLPWLEDRARSVLALDPAPVEAWLG